MNPGAGPVLSLQAVIAICLVSLAMSAFFSGAETGVMSVSRARLRRLLQEGGLQVRTLEKLLVRLEDPILTCLIGTNLFNVLFSALLTMVLTQRFGSRGEWYAVLIGATLVIFFGEILPKVMFREYPERLTLAAARPLVFFYHVLAPVRWILRGYSGLWRRLIPGQEEGSGLDRRSLSVLLLSNSVPTRHEEHFSQVMNRFLQLADVNLGLIMRPLDRLVTVGPAATVGDCLAIAASSGFSRLPVADEDGQGLFGYVLIRDLLFLGLEEHALPVPRSLRRGFLLVDARMSPYELFEELHSQGRQLAVVIDPAGNPLGMITLEDLIESVMGSISDEFDAVVQALQEE
ncbi:MAG: CNNM domain-containing protein [bacterium]